MVIDKLINRMVNDKNVIQSFVATVKSVDKNNATCEVTPLNGGADRVNVRLRSIIEENVTSGVVIFPEVGSKVICGVLENNASAVYVIGFSVVEEVRLKSDEFGGLVKVQELVNKMNAIEDKVNSIISAFNTHVHTGVTTGPGSSGATPSVVTGTLVETQKSDLENNKVNHG